MEKIDFVLPWVDSGDINWQAQKNKYQNNDGNDNVSNSVSRYRDMGTLLYVLRSIEKNCPWYNKIFLITQGHYPEWLDINHKKIELVTHQDLYYDKNHLPTFNSSSIEMNLGNIKNLSEKFIYLNDDMIFMRNLSPNRFFIEDKPVDFFIHGWLSRNRLFAKLRFMDAWTYSVKNNIDLINKLNINFSSLKNECLYHRTYSVKDKISNFLMCNLYRKLLWIKHWHHPQPYLKSSILEVLNQFHHEMMICSANKFRKNNDLTQYLYRYWQLIRGNFIPYNYKDGLDVDLVSIEQLKKDIDKIEVGNINFVCFNDSPQLSELNYCLVKEYLLKFLEYNFPEKASFERV